MWELFIKGGVLMWPLLVLSVCTLGLGCAQWIRLSMWKSRVVRVDDPAQERALGMALRTESMRINLLSLAATLAPLLGLTGTVLGLIQCFMDMEQAGVSSHVFTSGMWQALLTTALGLLIGMVAHTAHHLLRDKLDMVIILLEQDHMGRR